MALEATAATAPIGNTTRDSDCDSGRPFFPVIHTNSAMATGTQKNKAFIRPCVGQQRLPQSRHGSQVQESGGWPLLKPIDPSSGAICAKAIAIAVKQISIARSMLHYQLFALFLVWFL